MYMNFMIHHVVNKDDVMNGVQGRKPEIREAGPYSFKEVRRKEDILEVAGEKVHYAQYYEYHYDAGNTAALGETCLSFNQERLTVLIGKNG